jgi:hypothetical protein
MYQTGETRSVLMGGRSAAADLVAGGRVTRCVAVRVRLWYKQKRERSPRAT